MWLLINNMPLPKINISLMVNINISPMSLMVINFSLMSLMVTNINLMSLITNNTNPMSLMLFMSLTAITKPPRPSPT